MNSINRRRFIKNTSTGLFGFSWMARLFGTGQNRTDIKSKVVVVKDQNILNNQNKIQADKAQDMMDAGIKSLTGIDDVGKAWKSIFPNISSEKVISIKVNCLFALSSHPEIAYAIANGLQQMNVNGASFPANNIIIWDRSDWDLTSHGGYTINTGSEGVLVVGTNHSGFGYTSQTYNVKGSTQRISKILTDHSDYLINLCVLKDHGTADVTFSMKNHYGTCNDPGSLHGSRCNPYIPALNKLSPILDKQVLSICDALFAIRSGGPSGYPQVTPKQLIFSQDPVAHDTICLDILNEYRNTPINMPAHISTAASAAYQLGTNDRNQIERIDINSDISSSVQANSVSPMDFQLFQNYPNPFNGQTTLSYRINKSEQIRIEILDIQGRPVRTLFDGTKNAGFHQLQWDGKNQNYQPIPSGVYLAKIQGNQSQQTIRMQLLK
ncbi:DUF362 domain-containing protein [bacterium]